jgi:L-threonylcarbamoyladenylate synthase
MNDVEAAIRALRGGGVAVIPTDTVYGLVADAGNERAARALYEAKGRDARRPTAILFSSVEELLTRVPELSAEVVEAARALLPGPLTLVLPNPGLRFAWLNEERPEALGVRVPGISGPGKEILDALGALVATSANQPGGPDPRVLADVPPGLLAAVDAVLDGGPLPGTPSTVIDLTRAEPVVLREGVLPAAEVLARLRTSTDTISPSAGNTGE